MRTTLTLDDDVAMQIERLRRERDATLKDVVNELLRERLQDVKEPRKKRVPFRMKPIDVGEVLLPNIDNIAEVLSIVEGDNHK